METVYTQQAVNSQPSALALIQAREADVEALSQLTRALDKKVVHHISCYLLNLIYWQILLSLPLSLFQLQVLIETYLCSVLYIVPVECCTFLIHHLFSIVIPTLLVIMVFLSYLIPSSIIGAFCFVGGFGIVILFLVACCIVCVACVFCLSEADI